MLIINGTVHTMDGLVIPNGYVAVSEGKIARVGPMEECPTDWRGEVLDADQGHIMPGFVDAHSHLGMFGDALGFEADDGNESTDPCTPHLRAIDAINPLDRCFQEAREAGVTTVLTGPGSANPISGQFAAIKTAGRWIDAMVLKAPVAMKMATSPTPMSAPTPSSGRIWPRPWNMVKSWTGLPRMRTRISPITMPSWKPCFPWSGASCPSTFTPTGRMILPPESASPRSLI